MICEHCGVLVPEGRESCPSCGARVYPAPSYQPPPPGPSHGYGTLVARENARARNKNIGILLLVIGLILLPVAFFTFFMTIGWIFCPAAGICIIAGIVTIATNLSSSKG
jgi:hypothetical protein